ncbi:hypothetical protein BH18ACT14_BH18ACT14_12400 [soil metagenome]
MSEGAAPEAGQPKKKGWWGRRSKKAKVGIILAVVLIAIIAAASSGGSGDRGSGDNGSADNGSANEESASKDGPLVRGTWNGDCNEFSGGDQDACKAMRVSKVTCQWQDDHVHMTVVIKNTFGAHVTVHMNPIYKLKNAGIHGEGLTAMQDIGLDPGELRTYEADQEPKGVSGQPAITLCRPGVDTLQGVALG